MKKYNAVLIGDLNGGPGLTSYGAGENKRIDEVNKKRLDAIALSKIIKKTRFLSFTMYIVEGEVESSADPYELFFDGNHLVFDWYGSKYKIEIEE